MNSLGENEFCETNVKVGAKRTNDSLSFLIGINFIHFKLYMISLKKNSFLIFRVLRFRYSGYLLIREFFIRDFAV
jgi:hypothetical protein